MKCGHGRLLTPCGRDSYIAGSDEWKQMLQALCSKIIQHHWSEAKEFAALAGTHGQLPAPLKELLVHRITAEMAPRDAWMVMRGAFFAVFGDSVNAFVQQAIC